MNSEEADLLFDIVEKLAISNRALCTLFSRAEAHDTAIQDVKSHLKSTGRPAERGLCVSEELAQDIGGSACDEGSMGIVKPMTAKRLDDTRQDISAKKSTWAELRKQFSPKGTLFEPKKLITNKRATTSTSARVSEMDAKLAVDEVYSQVAAMAAYGVEALRVALSGPQVDRKLTERASDMLATLCATLLGTLEQHRVEINGLVAERVAARRRELGLGSESERASNSIDVSRHAGEDISQAVRRSKRLSNGSVRSERSHPYRRNASHVETLGSRRHSTQW
ncbi:hypothetical protein IWW37_002465 [Coemansia sp. RSA 2050]|nr:hypothetical protein IWW37_002465 [Coemansia sp. RSA 2050]